MLEQFMRRGVADALRRFGCVKYANVEVMPKGFVPPPTSHATPLPPIPPAAPNPGPAAAAASAPGFADRARAFGAGQWGAAKDLFGNLRQGLGGAATPEAGMAARASAVGNVKTLAPSLLAGGALYMLHRHNQAKRDAEARQHAMMAGGYPSM